MNVQLKLLGVVVWCVLCVILCQSFGLGVGKCVLFLKLVLIFVMIKWFVFGRVFVYSCVLLIRKICLVFMYKCWVFFIEQVILQFGSLSLVLCVMIMLCWFGSGWLIELYVLWFIMMGVFMVVCLKCVRFFGRCQGRVLLCLIMLLWVWVMMSVRMVIWLYGYWCFDCRVVLVFDDFKVFVLIIEDVVGFVFDDQFW